MPGCHFMRRNMRKNLSFINRHGFSPSAHIDSNFHTSCVITDFWSLKMDLNLLVIDHWSCNTLELPSAGRRWTPWGRSRDSPRRPCCPGWPIIDLVLWFFAAVTLRSFSIQLSPVPVHCSVSWKCRVFCCSKFECLPGWSAGTGSSPRSRPARVSRRSSRRGQKWLIGRFGGLLGRFVQLHFTLFPYTNALRSLFTFCHGIRSDSIC